MDQTTTLIPAEWDLKLVVTQEELQALVLQGKDLDVIDINDRIGLEKVHAHRMLLKNKRVEIEKGAKNLRDNATRYSRAVSAREKEFLDIIASEEVRLKAREDWVDQEKERLRQAEEKKKADALQARIDALHAVGASHDLAELTVMPDEVFAEILEGHTQAFNNKKALEDEQRIAKEAEAAKERERQAQEAEQTRRDLAELKRMKVEQEEQAAQLKAEQDKLTQEKAAFEEIQRADAQEKINAQKMAAAVKKAADDARIEAEQKVIREKAEKEEADRIEKIRKEEELAAAPDREKLRKLGEDLSAVIAKTHSMDFDTKKGLDAYGAATDQISDAITTWLIPKKKNVKK